jgi:hypothetical protein
VWFQAFPEFDLLREILKEENCVAISLQVNYTDRATTAADKI